MPKPIDLKESSSHPSATDASTDREIGSKGSRNPWRGHWVRLYCEKTWENFLKEGIVSGGLKPNHLKVFLLLLTVVNEDGEVPFPQVQLAKWVGMKPSTMTSVLKGLEEWGIIVRLGGRGQDFGLMFNPQFAPRSPERELDELIERFDQRWRKKYEVENTSTSVTTRHHEAPHPLSKKKGPNGTCQRL